MRIVAKAKDSHTKKFVTTNYIPPPVLVNKKPAFYLG